jgi:ketosteroid isomerase-like protein
LVASNHGFHRLMLSTSDRLAILDVVTRADAAATRRDADAYVSFFTDSAVLDGSMGEYSGKDLLRESVGPIWAAEGTMSVHVTLNAVVDEVDGHPDRAVVSSHLLILKIDTAIALYGLSAVVQHLVRVEGNWLIGRRSVSNLPSA